MTRSAGDIRRYHVFVSLYVSDANSQKADAWRKANPAPIDFIGLHRIELRNALSLAVFQHRITLAQAQAAWTQVQEDLKSGVLIAKADAWDKLIPEGETLASNQTPTLGTRTLDVLHVAAARARARRTSAHSMASKRSLLRLLGCKCGLKTRAKHGRPEDLRDVLAANPRHAAVAGR